MSSILILGSGFIGDYFSELLQSLQVPYAATTRDGRNNTISWQLPSTIEENLDISPLPLAKTVVITFPVKDPAIMKDFIEAYNNKYHENKIQWILLSSTRPFTSKDIVNNRFSPLDPIADTGRLPSEEVVLKYQGTVLHLAGLWGGQRQPKNWVKRFATEERVKSKILVRQLHLIHGKDVARGLYSVHDNFKPGERWLLTDGGCYDWLKLFKVWGSEEQITIIRHLLTQDDDILKLWNKNQTLEELIESNGVKPRLDSEEFWETFDLKPTEFLSFE